MTSRWKRIACRSMRGTPLKSNKKIASTIASSKHHQCGVCGHRFISWHTRAPDICRPCGEIAFEIERVAGAQFVTEKAVLAARSRQVLPMNVLDASTVVIQEATSIQRDKNVQT